MPFENIGSAFLWKMYTPKSLNGAVDLAKDKKEICFWQSLRGTYIYRPSILHSCSDESAPTGVNAVLLISQPSFYQLAVHVNGHYVALHRNAQLVPLAIKEGMKVAAFKRVAESVLQQALGGKLHRLLATVNHDRYLRNKETSIPSYSSTFVDAETDMWD